MNNVNTSAALGGPHTFRDKLGFAVWGIRWLDFPFFTAFPTMGALLAMPALDARHLFRLAFFIICNLVFAAQVYIYNDWSDGTLNPAEPAKRPRHALKRRVLTTRELFGVIVVLFILSVAGYAALSPRLVPIVIFLEIITVLYSHPRINFKGRPVAGTLVHLAGAFGYFCAGWMVFSPLNKTALALAAFFGLVLSAGHYSNEIEDFSNDLAAGLRTNAIAFGQRAMFRLGLWLFALSSVLFIVIAATALGVTFTTPSCGVVHVTRPFYLALSGSLLLVWLVQAWRRRGWKGGDRIQGFRSSYRLIYASFCGLLVAIKIIEWTMLKSLIGFFCAN